MLEMKGKLNPRSRRASQRASQRGQVLSFTAAIITLMSIAALLFTAFSVNVYAYTDYNNKMQTIADQVAELVDARGYFLGAKRPQYQTTGQYANDTKRIASDYANLLAVYYGLPPHSVTVGDTSEMAGDYNITFTKVKLHAEGLRLPFDVAGVLPRSVTIDTIGLASESSETPPAFIRFGFKLIDPSQSNPSVTNATQVVMLPAYGFQTDAVGNGFVGGTANNADVTANQPDPRKCLWAGVNASPNPLRSNAAFVTGPDGRQVTSFN